MNRKTTVYLSLIILLALTILAPIAQAQGEDLDTFLARTTAKSFLITLTRPELAGVMNFYRLDSVSDETLAAVQDPPVTEFEIVESGWVSDVSYQVRAILQPEDREIVIYTGQYDGRWRVEGLDLLTDQPGEEETERDASSSSATTTTASPAAVSGNGSGRLLFQTSSGGDIYIINADGTGLQRITHGIDPQLSPDGSRIAFTRWEPRYELFTMGVDGSDERSLTQNWRQMKSPTWSADGSKLIYSYQDGGRLDAETHRISLEDYLREHGEAPDIPPEAVGLKVEHGILTYTIPADAYWFLAEVDLADGKVTPLPTERHSYGPTAHPTQPHLVAYKGQRGIALHNLETGLDQPISSDHRDHTPVISPDGSRVAVSYWQHGHWEIHTMNIDGSDRRRLTDTPINVIADRTGPMTATVASKVRYVAPASDGFWNNTAPTWSPDGSQIAFVTDRTGQWEIWIMNADGSNQRPMFSNGALADLTLSYAGVDERMLSWR